MAGMLYGYDDCFAGVACLRQAKNTANLMTLIGLSSLWMVHKRLLKISQR
jgi:hypothetical protein